MESYIIHPEGNPTTDRRPSNPKEGKKKKKKKKETKFQQKLKMLSRQRKHDAEPKDIIKLSRQLTQSNQSQGIKKLLPRTHKQ
jgi:DNA-binding transcriptional regulator GbsR (MarR family)